jgi:predicted Zn-dependent protease with MMP-like domain
LQLERFEELSREYWQRIPGDYKEGIDGVVVQRRPREHPAIRDVYTLGECITEDFPSAYGGPDTTRSVVVLYYGSFQRLSQQDAEFDWEGELWETLTHELRHHLESLADDDALEDVDYAAEENFKRHDGNHFDPFFYRSGEPVLQNSFAIEEDVFIERAWRRQPPRAIDVEWEGRFYHVHPPQDPGDICFVTIVDGIEPPPLGEITVVLVRRTGWLSSLRSCLKRAPPYVVEVAAVAHGGPARSA